MKEDTQPSFSVTELVAETKTVTSSLVGKLQEVESSHKSFIEKLAGYSDEVRNEALLILKSDVDFMKDNAEFERLYKRIK